MRVHVLALALSVASATVGAAPACTTLTSEDALLVVDVQNDFLETRPAANRSVSGPHTPAYPIPPSERTGPGGSDIAGGSLAVPGSAVVADRTQDWYEAFSATPGPRIFASQDWHPLGHCSFCRNGTAAGNPEGFHPHGAVCFSGKDVPTSVMNATNRCHDGESELLWSEDKYVQWPDHCRQGSFGARFDPFLGIPPRTVVVQKGFEHHLDSYSAFGGRVNTTGESLADALTAAGVRRLWVLGVALDYCVQQSTLDALGANPGTGRKAPPTLESVILVRSATAAVNATAGEEKVQDILHAGGHVVTAPTVDGAIAQFCSQH